MSSDPRATGPPLERRRTLEPVVAITGRVVHWRCSVCNWTHILMPGFTGFMPSRETRRAFERHVCAEHADGKLK